MKYLEFTMLILGLAAASFAHADSVTLTNNDRITGTVISIAGGKLQLKTEHMGKLNIPMDQVVAISREKPITIRTESGEKLTGSLASQDGQQVINTANGPALVDTATVKRAFEDHLISPRQKALSWNSRIDLGYTLTTGNSETQTLSVHGEGIVKHGRWEHRLFAGLDTDEADNQTTKDQIDTSYDLRWYFRDRWYALGNISYFQDKLKDVDRRVIVGAGIGHQFWDNSLGALSADLGVSQIFEDLDGENESNPALRWGLNWNRWLRPEALEIFHNNEILKILGSGRGAILNASTGLRLHINRRWNAHFRVDIIHETEPLPTRDKTDATYVMGVGLVF